MELLTLERTRDQAPDETDDRAPRSVTLAACRLLHPHAPQAVRVRRGLLRVSEILPDGRELTRAILHPGSGFRIRRAAGMEADPERDVYRGDRLILMALDETEIQTWPLAGEEGNVSDHE